ncbi:16S rRNA (cytosine(1402)-N(4))-methyltransferase, partial [Cylindrospermopsis raciborskii CS-506_B]
NSDLLTVMTKKPITATESEIQHNPRSRSAKLRIAQKVAF